MRLPGEKKLVFDHTLIMGILNVTPDSFSDGGKYIRPDEAWDRAARMIDEGADIIDIGGESSRPGSEPVESETELFRVLPVIEKIRKHSNISISIDTTKAEVARRTLDAGADIINDISALRFDKEMINVANEFKSPVVLMHMQGMPKTMQDNPQYDDCIKEIREFFEERLVYCRDNGMDKSRLIIDPGIGFGKGLQDNLAILRRLHVFKELGAPLLLGVSRKSFISAITGNKKSAEARLGGSLAALITAVQANCDIVRVHDVAETVEAIKVVQAIKQAV